MSNISSPILSPGVPKIRKLKKKSKSKEKENALSNTHPIAEGGTTSSNGPKTPKPRPRWKMRYCAPATSSQHVTQDGASPSASKPNNRAKKTADVVIKSPDLIPLMSLQVKDPTIDNLNIVNKKSPKKTHAYFGPYYRGLQAFNSIKKNKANILNYNSTAIKEIQCSDDNVVIPFDIEWVCEPAKACFIRKRSSNKHVNLHLFGSKSPVVFETRYKDQSLGLRMKKSNEELDNVSLSSKVLVKAMDDLKLGNDNNSPVEVDFITQNKGVDSTTESIKSTKKKKRARKKATSPMKKNCNKGVLYPEYISLEEVDEGLSNGSLVKGCIRINRRNFNEAYVSSITKGDTDYIIKSVLDQNRALEGDDVVLQIKPQEEWDSGRKTASVVFVSKMVHPRTTIGKLTPISKNETNATFIPRDHRFPNLLIPSISWPPGFKENPNNFEKNIFLAQITEWTHTDQAKGVIIENIGMSGDLKIENLAILKCCGLRIEPFDNEVLQFLPKTSELKAAWLVGREDLRKDCIFTIDPLTARDLDDAVSCKVLHDGNLEVGVHIADVGFFLKEGTALDKQVAKKATTIYMVDQVYHMLPVQLCMECSLLPGKNKLSFSVFWTMTPEGEIFSTRFAKTVINSCAQLAYEHAQAIIEDPDNFDRSAMPTILNGYNLDDAKDVILRLYRISKNLRRKRYENGALRIDQKKLSFELDHETGNPVKYYVQESKEANWLIEEFMLLANMSVAAKILEHFPDVAFLRLHEPPKLHMLVELQKILESVGIHVNISSAQTIHNSLLTCGSDDEAGRARLAVLNHFFAKAMTRARYFCPAVEGENSSFTHYALNIPLYTHFTSPIRRYADIVVHRLLAASLGLAEKPKLSAEEVGEIATRCNLIKYNAKKAQEESSHLYLCHYIFENQPFIRTAAVVEVRERSFDVMVLECGEVVRIHLHDVEGASYEVEDITNMVGLDKSEEFQKKYWSLTISYPPTKEHAAVMTVIELFTLVRVLLRKCPKTQKLQAKLVRPNS